MATEEQSSGPLSVRAPAKVNLFLELLGRRDDGYHELVTLMQTVDLCDTVTLEPRPAGIALDASGGPVASGPDNLAWRAAALLLERAGVRGGVRIGLEKRIPVGAGLGGGSSDAAAVLNGLNALYGCGVGPTELERWAAELGSDAPFFVRGGTARCAGRGQIVTPLAGGDVPVFYCLILPEVRVDTAEVYRSVPASAFEGTRRSDGEVQRRLADGDLAGLGRALFNRLESVTFGLHPELAAIWEAAAAESPPGVLMSGSGSCIYSLHESQADAERMKRALDAKRLPARTVLAQTF